MQTVGLPLASADATSTVRGNWKDELHQLQPYARRGSSLDQLITKLSSEAEAVPDTRETNLLVNTCMFHGETKILTSLLAGQPLDELSLSYSSAGTLSLALKTLLDAMPSDWSVRELTLVQQKLDGNGCTLLLDVVARINPSTVSLQACTLTIDPHVEIPDCEPLSRLDNLHFDMTRNTFPLLQKILAASQVGVLRLRSSAGLVIEQHDHIALTLKKQAKLGELKLQFSNAESLHPVICCYADFLKSQVTVEHLDLSHTPLTSDDCDKLWDALQNKPLTRLSLSACWAGVLGRVTPEQATKLCSLQRLRHIDFSSNALRPEYAEFLLAELANHPALQYLNLDGTYIPDEAIGPFGSHLAGNTTLVSVQLPYMSDENFARLAKAMETNRSLHYLSAPFVEKSRDSMASEDFSREFKSYLALVMRTTTNKRQAEETLVELVAGGMQQALTGLGKGQVAPLDVARYAASIAVATNGTDKVKGWATLNKLAAQGASNARARLQDEASNNVFPPQEHDKH